MSKHLPDETYSLTPVEPDKHGNYEAVEGCDLCTCGVKYWENDECVDCGTHINTIRALEREADAMRDGFGYGALYLLASNSQ